MSLRLAVAAVSGDFKKEFSIGYKPIEAAAQRAMVQAAAEIKTAVRADMARAGFSTRWQNTLRVDVYPKRGESINAAAHVWHKIPYAGVFERGAVIRGKPVMWLPLRTTPKRIGSKRMTAELFIRQIGPLRKVTRGNKPPLLVASFARAFSKTPGAGGPVTLAELRRGKLSAEARKRARLRLVTQPMFVGVSTVSINKKFGVSVFIERTSEKLAAFYFANLEV